MRLCIQGGLIIDPVNNFAGMGTVWIEDGIIVCVEAGHMSGGNKPLWADEQGVKRIDAKGKWVVPGLVDLHVHFRDPGFEYKEDILSGCNAAIKGGFTKVCCMPNTMPVIDCADVVSYIHDKASKIQGIEVFVIGAVTKGQQGKELADIDGMVKMGICAISEDGKTVMNARLMRDAMVKAAQLGIPFFSHAEDESLAGTAIGEELIVARDILLAKETGCKLHLCHISTQGSVDIIRKAKADGIHVTAEVAPHHFTLDESSVNVDGNKKMSPPLRTVEDVAAMKDALADGTIDAIATDHAPHSKEEKETNFDNAPNGVIGLETSFAVSYTMLVKTGILTPMELIAKMSTRPAEILGIKPSSISAGEPADIIIVDVEQAYEICSEDFGSKSVNSPFIGMTVYGRPYHLNEVKEQQ